MPSFKLLEAAAAEPSFLQVVAMGLITVFVVLICLLIIIKVMGAIMAGAGKAAPAPAPAAPAAAAPPGSAAAPKPNKQQLVAAISAAIAEDMGGSVDHIRIHSIRKL